MLVSCMDGVICITTLAFDLTLLVQSYTQYTLQQSLLFFCTSNAGGVLLTILGKELSIGYQSFAMEKDPGSE